MTLSVLTDDQIRFLLENLAIDELENFRAELRAALHQYSTGTQVPEQSLIQQPSRTSINNNVTGGTTLYMPSVSPAGHAIKVITLSSAENQDHTNEAERPIIKPTGAITLFSPDGAPVGILNASTPTAFRTALASLCLVQKREHVRTLAVFGGGEQAYWHVRLTLMLRGATTKQVHIINRRFSPSLKQMMHRLYTVPTEMKVREGWAGCTFGVLTPKYGDYKRLLATQLLDSDVIFCCTPSTVPLFDAEIMTNKDARRKGRLFVAIGSYTPMMREIPVGLIHQATSISEKGHHRHFHRHAVEGGVVVVDTLDGALKEAGELIEAGILPNQLVELGELVMLQQADMADAREGEVDASSQPDSSSRSSVAPSVEFEKLDLGSFSGPGSSMSSVFLDSGSPTVSGGGSISPSRASSPGRKSTSSPHRRSFSFDRRSSEEREKKHQKKKKEKEDHLSQWLHNGNVIYKSVGLALMDLTVGMHLIRFAREKGVGSHVEGF
ncbi:hypothetical protein B0T26DRAFT_409447 [Lasiosphaeria miniovina]|uniref:Ornithine cyclodeaminase n=1 Tax=Lasiosphaeria miniovina TaxID=1954250 RepID=A0AA40DQH5_9PEZI|nr:uncharacterized protein B0T26DRAFT_409447 [Lasiosphaeria miniovina]KAK0709522.1 hypothetical protein B0T26DRAFT_409447 [Lasiosphaeria miniovina]